MGPGDGVEVVEQGGDAVLVELVHDRAGPTGGGDQIERADALFEARDIARRHRQVAVTEPESSAVKRGSPAISPQMLIGFPRRNAASTANWISRSTAGTTGCRDPPPPRRYDRSPGCIE